MKILLYPLLVVLFLFVLAQATPKNTKQPVAAAARRTVDDTLNSISPLQFRSLDDWTLSLVIIVTDIDGSLHGIDRGTGAFLWSLPIDEPLVQVLGSDGNSSSNLLWFVEPYDDGSLYFFSPAYGLNKLPTSIKSLVMESPFSLSGDDKIYTGTRRTSLVRLNVNTGEILDQFGATQDDEACPIPNVYRNMADPGPDANYVMLGKTTYEVSIHSKDESSVVWNVSYSHWGPNNIDTDLKLQNHKSIDSLYFTPFHDKSLLAVSQKTGAPAWLCRLPSLAVNVFDIFYDSNDPGHYVLLPHPIKEFNAMQVDSETDNLDLCFINRTATNKEWFAMSYQHYPALIKSAPTSGYQMALEKYENGYLDRDAINKLQSLRLNGEDAGKFISGVHKIVVLDPSKLYQPAAKFNKEEPKLINGKPNDSRNLPQTITPTPQKQLPNIMDGILFPLHHDSQVQDLSPYDYSQEVVVKSESGVTKSPARRPIYEEFSELKPHREKISVFRRIAEDLLVMSALLFFFFAFGKVNQILKSRKSDSESSPELSISKDNVVTQNEAGSVDSTLEKVIQPGKKVSILVPEENASDNEGSNDEDLRDDADTLEATKKKRKRGGRGGKRISKAKKQMKEDDTGADGVLDRGEPSVEAEANEDHGIQTTSLVKNFMKPPAQKKKLQIDSNLVISDKILGYGSHGTVVYEGTFENRPVAVKRMLLDFYDIANHEVRLLQESDDHPNVIRYFCSQSSEKEKFLYIALELCVCSLDEIIEKQIVYPEDIHIGEATYNDVLQQLASGLSYLHSLKIVHRDIKPQNILVGENSSRSRFAKKHGIRLLISDFGLCKKLDSDQSSFRATTQHAASGTSGWRAPELLLDHDISEISPDTVGSMSSFKSNSNDTRLLNGQPKRLTKAIDIFSLGCVFYYILSGGGHPFGDRYLREGNIIRGEFDLSLLKKFCPTDYVEASDLVSSMIEFDPRLRPDTATVLKHPYFWSVSKKLEFLLKVSDRFEIERRDPPSDLLLTLEKISDTVHQGDWHSRFAKDFIDNLGKYRKYNTEKVMDLLRALRNKYHHYNDMPPELQSQMSPLPAGFYQYFNLKFPNLLMEIYSVVKVNMLHESIFQEFL